MTGLVFAAVLVLADGARMPCERLELEVGQAACFSQCVEREPVCAGDERVKCDQVDIVHGAAVDRVELR